MRPVSSWVLASSFAFGGGGGDWSGAGGGGAAQAAIARARAKARPVRIILDIRLPLRMQSDSARREIGAGMRRKRVAFASAALVPARHPRELPTAIAIEKIRRLIEAWLANFTCQLAAYGSTPSLPSLD